MILFFPAISEGKGFDLRERGEINEKLHKKGWIQGIRGLSFSPFLSTHYRRRKGKTG